ncbi:MAG TPA: hypothetical protein VF628_13980 [Allosphingosinicella sp.]|jgi:hypothetical protein
MLKRIFRDDILSWLRSNAVGVASLVAGSIAFIAASVIVLRSFEANFVQLASSSWVSPPHDEVKQPYVAGQRYDLSKHGVNIPPSRDDRAKEADSQNAAQGAEYYRRGCYEKANTLEDSDLCAQWSNAAAVRFGNRIALESFRLNSWIGFLTAFGVFLASIGVVFAGMASLQASRGLLMMAYGFMPALSFSVQKAKAGRIKVTVRNVGTGPASDIRVSVGGERAAMQQDRLGAGAHTTLESWVGAEVIEISAACLDLSKKQRTFHQRFIWAGGEWVLSEEQPENAQ